MHEMSVAAESPLAPVATRAWIPAWVSDRMVTLLENEPWRWPSLVPRVTGVAVERQGDRPVGHEVHAVHQQGAAGGGEQRTGGDHGTVGTVVTAIVVTAGESSDRPTEASNQGGDRAGHDQPTPHGPRSLLHRRRAITTLVGPRPDHQPAESASWGNGALTAHSEESMLG